MGILVPEEFGGSGLGYHEYVAIIDEISRVDPSIGLSIAAHNSLCTNHIFKFGSSEQHNKERNVMKNFIFGTIVGMFIATWGIDGVVDFSKSIAGIVKTEVNSVIEHERNEVK